MAGLGTVINTCAIIVGGILGIFFGRFIKEQLRSTLITACGVCVMFIGTAGALEGMLTVTGSSISSGRAMFLVLSIALGGLVGELINIEGAFERFGEWLKQKTGSAKDAGFVNGFVTASLTVCIGAMAIVGAIEDGLTGNWSLLATKAALDFVIIMIMTGSLGKGCIFSAIPVALLQGGVTVLARAAAAIMTEKALSNLSLSGSVLIFCVGINLVWGIKVRVANLLPAVIFAAAFAYLPFEF